MVFTAVLLLFLSFPFLTSPPASVSPFLSLPYSFCHPSNPGHDLPFPNTSLIFFPHLSISMSFLFPPILFLLVALFFLFHSRSFIPATKQMTSPSLHTPPYVPSSLICPRSSLSYSYAPILFLLVTLFFLFLSRSFIPATQQITSRSLPTPI